MQTMIRVIRIKGLSKAAAAPAEAIGIGDRGGLKLDHRFNKGV